MAEGAADSLAEPDLIHVDSADWADEVVRDDYIERLQDWLRALEDCPHARVIWSDESEELLWNPETAPYWMQIPVWRNQLRPILIRRLHSRQASLGSVADVLEADISPAPEPGLEERPEWLVFRKLAHAVSELEIPCVVYGVPQQTESPGLACQCECHGAVVHPLVWNLPGLLRSVPLTRLSWPKDADVGALAQLMDLWRIAYFDGVEFNYEPQFSKTYMKRIVDLPEAERGSVVDAMVRRLVLSESQAGRDKSLNDETVSSGEHRIRVSRSRRIHYVYPSSGVLRFWEYYGEGEHDKGL